MRLQLRTITQGLGSTDDGNSVFVFIKVNTQMNLWQNFSLQNTQEKI